MMMVNITKFLRSLRNYLKYTNAERRARLGFNPATGQLPQGALLRAAQLLALVPATGASPAHRAMCTGSNRRGPRRGRSARDKSSAGYLPGWQETRVPAR